jgi:hypothetical protein
MKNLILISIVIIFISYFSVLCGHSASIEVYGAIKSSVENHYILFYNDRDLVDHDIIIKGFAHSEYCEESCESREKIGEAIYIFEKDAGTQVSDRILWNITNETEIKDYKFKVKSITQNYKDCPPDTGISSVVSNESPEITISIIKIAIQVPNWHNAIMEGRDSGDFEVILTPAQPSATYSWRATWPEDAGNDPSVTFNAPNSRIAKIKKARWYAKPDSQWAAISSEPSWYQIHADVKIHGVSITASTSGEEDIGDAVQVFVADSDAVVLWKHYLDDDTIEVGQVGLYWKVIDKGNFRRHMVSSSDINYGGLPGTSEFYNIVKAHELVHVDQINNQIPWVEMWDVDAFYTNKLANPAFMVGSEAGLWAAIYGMIMVWNRDNMDVWNSYTCEREWAAFEAEYSISPFYRKMRKEDIEKTYGCTFDDE